MAEIAGRDSVAAVAALAGEVEMRRVLPTIAYAGTEYGDIDMLPSNVDRLRLLLRPMGVEVMEPVVLGSPLWWGAVIGRPNSLLSRRYGPWHICVGCHMYFHAVRVPLAWEAGAYELICGERLFHHGRLKVNQMRPAVLAYSRALAEWGITLHAPLLEIDDEARLLELAGEWDEGDRQPGCVLSGNYYDLDGQPLYDDSGLQAYLEGYLIPVTGRILHAVRDGEKADYRSIVEDLLG